MLTYEDCIKLFDTARNPDKGKPLANNTRLYKRGDEFEIVLHQTAVVSVLPEGKYIVRTGGWNTLTTRDRLNRYAPGRFFTEKGILYWSPRAGANPIIFEEGMIVGEEGKVYDYDADAALDHEQHVSDMKARIKRYLDGYMKALEARMPIPSGGDCWFCCMVTEEGLSMGDHWHDHDHLIDHMDTNYYVPSLVVNALREAGFEDRQLGAWLDPDGETIGLRSSFDKRYIRGHIRSYLTRRLVPGAAGAPTIGSDYEPSTGFAA